MKRVEYSKKFLKSYIRLPQNIRNKTDKQLQFLLQDLRYPSLQTKKVQGLEDVWEGRVDRHYRFLFMVKEDIILLITIGPHDEGLGKK